MSKVGVLRVLVTNTLTPAQCAKRSDFELLGVLLLQHGQRGAAAVHNQLCGGGGGVGSSQPDGRQLRPGSSGSYGAVQPLGRRVWCHHSEAACLPLHRPHPPAPLT